MVVRRLDAQKTVHQQRLNPADPMTALHQGARVVERYMQQLDSGMPAHRDVAGQVEFGMKHERLGQSSAPKSHQVVQQHRFLNVDRPMQGPLSVAATHEHRPLDGQRDQLGAHVLIDRPAQRAPRVAM